MLELTFPKKGGSEVKTYVSILGGTLLLTYADKMGEGGQKSLLI